MSGLGRRLAVRPELFGRILRRWQATRPLAMRRIAREARHEPPVLDDLFESASSPTGAIGMLGDLTVLDVASRTYQQDKALRGLWDLFSGLTTTESASCVGISKAVLLLTDGRIGPALDSQVRTWLGISKPKTAAAWIGVLGRRGQLQDRVSGARCFASSPGTAPRKHLEARGFRSGRRSGGKGQRVEAVSGLMIAVALVGLAGNRTWPRALPRGSGQEPAVPRTLRPGCRGGLQAGPVRSR